jgi:hypothetical protein
MRAAEDGVADEPVGWHPELGEARENRGFESAFGVIEREFDFA